MSWYGGGWGGWAPYVPVAERRRKALAQAKKLQKKGHVLKPVEIEGRAIAKTFWGQAWCRHMESLSDYSNRLPRGRMYARNGSVIDLQIEPGRVAALVQGSSLYKIDIRISTLEEKKWSALRQECSGKIDSLVELLQGRLSHAVMDAVTRKGGGLFPPPGHIKLDCSCPDYAGLCKHLAAVLYGIGARLDQEPDLLFRLRGVNHLDLVAQAGKGLTPKKKRGPGLAGADTGRLSKLFGIDLETPALPSKKSPPAKKLIRKSKGK